MKKNHNRKFGTKGQIIATNAVTALRFLGSFLILPVFKILGGIPAAIFSAVFMFTDSIDGFMARKFKASTFFGSLFDGFTDKVFGILAYAILLTINPVAFSIPILFEALIAIRQGINIKNGYSVKSSMLGKIKTWFLGLSIVSSFCAVDLMNLKSFAEYFKDYTLDKSNQLNGILGLLGINLPLILMQFFTFIDYNNKARNEAIKIVKKEEFKPKDEQKKDNIISKEKQDLLNKKEFLMQMCSLMFDPEYFEQNKDVQIRTLIKKEKENMRYKDE